MTVYQEYNLIEHFLLYFIHKCNAYISKKQININN